MTGITDIQLLRLHDCITSTRMGAVDKGFPATFQTLATLGLVKAKDGGYIATELGFATDKASRNRLFGPRKKPKKKDRFDDEQGDNE